MSSVSGETDAVGRSSQRAWVAWNPVDSTYSGYLASLDEDGGEVAQTAHAPAGLSFDQIIEWATEQAAQVFIRPHWDSGTTYWAGDGDHTGHPVLDRVRAVEAADRIGDGEMLPQPLRASGHRIAVNIAGFSQIEDLDDGLHE